MREYVDVVIFDGFADWQIALALTEIRRPGDFQVRTLGFTPASISAMSGFRVQPDLTVANWQPQHSALLLLPGCHPASAPLPAMSALARRAHMAEVALAAIDRGVSALAQTGLLDQQRHTANWPGQLGAEAPAYAGQRHYQADALAVREGRTITASQFGSIEFAREISALLQLYSSSDGEHWYRLFKHAIAPPWCGSVDAVRAA